MNSMDADTLWLEHILRSMPKNKRPIIKWTCSTCTFINRSYKDQCELCDTNKKEIISENPYITS